MSNVILIRDSLSISKTLRKIADAVDSGNLKSDSATLILGEAVYHFGNVLSDSTAAEKTVWDCNYAIAKLMKAALSEE